MRTLYLCLGLVQLVGVAVVWIARRDLRRVIYTAGATGAVIEIASEYLYLRDYWRPLTISPGPSYHGARWPWIEDGIYGFGVTALAACAVPFITSLWPRHGRLCYTVGRPEPVRRNHLSLIVLLVPLYMKLVIDLEWSSIYAVMGAFTALALYGMILRHDLILVGLAAAALMGCLALVGYAVGLDYLINGRSYLDQILVQAGSRLDIRILGQVPLDEVLWNTARGAAIAVLYPVFSGHRLVWVPRHQAP